MSSVEYKADGLAAIAQGKVIITLVLNLAMFLNTALFQFEFGKPPFMNQQFGLINLVDS
jgi:hypothetical protein